MIEFSCTQNSPSISHFRTLPLFHLQQAVPWVENFGRWNHREKPRWVTSDSQWPVEHAEIELKGRGEHVENPASDQDGKQPSATPRGVVTVTSKFGKLRVGWRLLTIIWYFHFTTQFHYVLIDYLPFFRIIPLTSIAQGFYIQSFSLTECIVIVGVRKTGGCLSVCLCVCVSVCVSVRARTPKLPGRFQWNFPKMIPSRSICVRLSLGSLT